MWKCQCSCKANTFCTVSIGHLKNGSTKSCGCLQRRLKNKNHRWTGFGEISGNIWSNIRSAAKNRNIDFNIDIKQAWDLYEKQGGRCYLTNLPLTFESDNRIASLDRINSKLDYNINNVAWCHRYINQIKWYLSIKQVMYYAKLITNPSQNINKHLDKTIITQQIWGVWYRGRKRRSRVLEWDINQEYILDLFNSQLGKCALTGIPIIIGLSGYTKKQNIKVKTASLDRIDNDIGYIKGNVQIVHKHINISRNNLSINDFIYFYTLINSNRKNVKLYRS